MATRWQEFQERRADADEITLWSERWPDANVGIVTGAISGFTVFDIDPRRVKRNRIQRASDAWWGGDRANRWPSDSEASSSAYS